MIRTDDDVNGDGDGDGGVWRESTFNSNTISLVRAPAYMYSACIKRSKSGNKTNSVSISNTRIVIHNATTAYTHNSVIKLLKWHSQHHMNE